MSEYAQTKNNKRPEAHECRKNKCTNKAVIEMKIHVQETKEEGQLVSVALLKHLSDHKINPDCSG